MLTNFRRQSDLPGYLQAASFAKYLLEAFGPAALAELWQHGATPDTVLGSDTLAPIEQQWRESLIPGELPTPSELARIEEIGCGAGPPPPVAG